MPAFSGIITLPSKTGALLICTLYEIESQHQKEEVRHDD